METYIYYTDLFLTPYVRPVRLQHSVTYQYQFYYVLKDQILNDKYINSTQIINLIYPCKMINKAEHKSKRHAKARPCCRCDGHMV